MMTGVKVSMPCASCSARARIIATVDPVRLGLSVADAVLG
jgi:hypothetical protein